MSRRWLSTLAAVAVVGVAAWFVADALAGRWEESRDAVLDARPGWLLAGAVAAAAGMSWIAWTWRAAGALTGAAMTTGQAVRWYLVGELGKYVPGGIWPVVGRGELARRGGIDRRAAYTSVALSLAAVYLANALFVAVLAGEPLALALVPAGALGLVVGRRVAPTVVPPVAATVGVVARYLPAWVLIGTATWCVAEALDVDGGWADVAVPAVFSWLVGFVVIPAPGGVGVREAAYVAASPLPDALAATVALAARLLFVTVDVALAAGAVGSRPMSLVAQVRNRLRGAAVSLEQRRDPRRKPWAGDPRAPYRRLCNICGWHGVDFEGFVHSESAICPSCGASARDRFVYHCFVSRQPYRPGLRVLETSPRMGDDYRRAMRERVTYTASDFDLQSHRADIAIDLQAIDLPDASLDTIVSAHVLEHVPDYERALAELHRVLAPGGHLFLMVPLQQGRTAPPTTPEFHEDNTPVHWRFGLDLTDRLRDAGFEATVLVVQDFVARLDAERWFDSSDPQFDMPSIKEGVHRPDLTVVADERTSRRLGFEPAFLFVAWEARRR